MALRVCDWKYGKQWVYSITYDEALADLHRHAIPLHEEFGFPGHVEAVAGQLGEVRQIGASSYNGFRHANGAELQDLIRRGWGVGNHSWSHELISAEPEVLDRELRQAREKIEAACGAPVNLFCSPGDNTNMAPHVLAACRALGYLGALSITDAPNRPEDELFWLNRTPLHDQFPPPFYSAFDPYRNLRLAQVCRGWIIDYCHCPLPEPVHRHKDCSADQLRQRFQAVREEGGDEVWCAVPDEVVFYHHCRRALRIETLADSEREQRYRLSFAGLSDRVTARELTFEATVPAAWGRCPRLRLDGQWRPATWLRPRTLRFTITIGTTTELVLGDSG